MKGIFFLLALGLVVIYVLMASKAIEFENKTLEQTGLIERVAAQPSFHQERLAAYLEDRWEAAKALPARLSRTLSKP